MLFELTPGQREIETFMSDISEKCWHAGWAQGTEYVLWDAVINGARAWGQDEITSAEIATLKQLAFSNDSWIYFDEDSEETAISLNGWQVMYQEAVTENPLLVERY